MFEHVELDLPKLSRETIDGVRYYSVPDEDKLLKLVSITSVTSHHNRDIFKKWRAKVGDAVADRVTRQATSRGTDTHTLTEAYLYNQELPEVQPLSKMLFQIYKSELNKISRVHSLEGSLYSKELGIAGTVDCIAEYNGELAIIDFKTSKKIKPEKWLENYFVQETAYACMYYEMTGIAVDKIVTLMVADNGDVKVYEKRNKGEYIKLLTKYIKEFVTHKLSEYGERG